MWTQECGEKQALLERTQREKKSVEKKLELAREREPVEVAKTEETLQQLYNRVHEVERTSEEARKKMEIALMAQRTAEAR